MMLFRFHHGFNVGSPVHHGFTVVADVHESHVGPWQLLECVANGRMLHRTDVGASISWHDALEGLVHVAIGELWTVASNRDVPGFDR